MRTKRFAYLPKHMFHIEKPLKSNACGPFGHPSNPYFLPACFVSIMPKSDVIRKRPSSKALQFVGKSSGSSHAPQLAGQSSSSSSSSSNIPLLAHNSSGNEFGETSTKAADEVMEEIRVPGRMPKETRTAAREENLLAWGIRRLKQNREFSRAQLEEMAAFSSNAPQLADEVMIEIRIFFRGFGRMPTRSALGEEALLAQKISRCKKNGEFSDLQIGEMATFAKRDTDRRATEIMDEIRGLGYIPSERQNKVLRRKWNHAVQHGIVTPEQVEEAQQLTSSHMQAIRVRSANEIMDEIRVLGYIPTERQNKVLCREWNHAVQHGIVSPEEVEEAERLTASHMQAIAESMDPPPEICQPPDALDPFADEATNHLEQDLLMASNGIRPRPVNGKEQKRKEEGKEKKRRRKEEEQDRERKKRRGNE